MALPNPLHLFGNWRDSDRPLTERVRLSLRNNLIKVRTASSCCGHPGEPGC
jgi:hypothetical protein